MDINQEAILKQQGHIQSLLNVHINPASMGLPEGTLGSHLCQATVSYQILLVASSGRSLLLVKVPLSLLISLVFFSFMRGYLLSEILELSSVYYCMYLDIYLEIKLLQIGV